MRTEDAIMTEIAVVQSCQRSIESNSELGRIYNQWAARERELWRELHALQGGQKC